jgi:hypothetical protein
MRCAVEPVGEDVLGALGLSVRGRRGRSDRGLEGRVSGRVIDQSSSCAATACGIAKSVSATSHDRARRAISVRRLQRRRS